MKFLEEKLFKDMKKITQGSTCGIHIHWSNKDLLLYPDINEYLFEFIKIIYFLRKYISNKVISTEFSGRKYLYDKINNDLILNFQTNFKGFYCFDPISYELKFTKNLNINKLVDEVKNINIKVYVWKKNIKNNYDKIKSFIEVLANDNLKNYTLLLLFLTYNTDNIFTNYGLKLIIKEKIDIHKLIKYLNKNYKNIPKLIIKENLIKVILNILDKKKNKYIENFTILLNIEYKRELDSKFIKILSEFNNFKRILLGSTTISNDNKNLKNILIKNLMKPKILRLGDYKDINIKFIMNEILTKFTKQPISIYDIKDFHMEFRLFSLDKLFEGKGPRGPKAITNKLEKFIYNTDYFMTKIITELNNNFDPKIKDIPKHKKQRYNKLFLMDKEYKPSNNIVLKKFKELFNIHQSNKTKRIGKYIYKKTKKNMS